MRARIAFANWLIAAFAVLGCFAGSATAMPADPERPLAVQTCTEAQARLTEAQVGSPLLSPDEQTQVLQQALTQAARLCSGEQGSNGALHPAILNPITPGASESAAGLHTPTHSQPDGAAVTLCVPCRPGANL